MTPRGWSLLVGAVTAALWTLGGGVGSFVHSWMPRRSWMKTLIQAVVAALGVGLAARIGWSVYPQGRPAVVTIIAIGLGWSAFGATAGVYLASADGATGSLTSMFSKLLNDDNRLEGVIDGRLRVCTLQALAAGAARANDIVNPTEPTRAANLKRLKAAEARGRDDLIAMLRKMIVSGRITRGALSGNDGFFKRWPE